MKCKVTLMMLAGLLMVQSVAAQVEESVNSRGWRQKVSPLLCEQMKQAKEVSRRAPGTETYLGALVKLAEGQNGYVLRKEGSLLLDSLDQFYIALLPASRIQAMAETGSVEVIEAHEEGELLMDVTHKTVGADQVQAGNLSLNIPAYTGKGVVVGISDIGMDYTHPMFRNADGTLAIKKAWDAYADNSNGYGGIGAIYDSQEQLLAAEGTKDHSMTHGTHVMGIAAGRPWKAFDSGNKEVTYCGIAYDADIISATSVTSTHIQQIDEMMRERLKQITKEGAVAEILNAKINTNNILPMLSIKMTFDYAKEHNQPCVVNCSWGGIMRFIDRTAAEDEFLGKLVGPGRILVAGAGNSGDSHIYTEKPDGQYEWEPNVILRSPESAFTMHSDEEFILDLSLYKQSDPSAPQYSLNPSVTSEELRKHYDDDTNSLSWKYTNESGVEETIELDFGYVKNDIKGYDYYFNFSFPKDYFQAVLAYMTLKLRSNGKIRLLGTPDRLLFEDNNKNCNSYTLGWPGISPHSIAVGVTSHRNYVTNIYGNQEYSSGNSNQEGYIVNWSSCGPTLDGRMKPDVVAPGYNLVSARSKLYKGTEEWNDDEKMVVASKKDGEETREVLMESGTSMAAPLMTGVVALWLQAKPTLTREQIMETLSRTAKKLDAELYYPNCIYGYGEVDAYAGLLDILGIPAAIPTLSSRQAAITMEGRTLYIQDATEPVTVNVYSINGQLVFTAVATDGSVTLPQLPAAVYAVQAGTLGSTLIRL